MTRSTRVSALVLAFLASPLALTACGAGGGTGSANIVGNWVGLDGSTKVIDGAGNCTGMYYNAGQPLDIGGPMTCSLSSSASNDGTYTLVVTQSPNQETLHLRFLSNNKVEVLDGGAVVDTLTRQ